MDTIKLYVGRVQSTSSGIVQDDTKPVEFVAEERATLKTLGTHKGNLTDTRGITQTLYETDTEQLVVHVEDWSNWQREPTTYDLHLVNEGDLQPGGRFADLGAEAGYGRPLTLDEAIRE